MSCSELGLSEYGLRISKSADVECIGTAPTATDLSDYTAELVFRASESAASALLTINLTPTASGSVIVLSGNLITFRVKMDDAATIPDAADPDEPYIGVCELVVIAPTGLRSRVFLLPAIVEKGAAR